MARIDELFQYLKERKGSDLHLAAGLEPRIRVHGSLAPVAGWPVLSHFDLLDLLREIASDAQWAEYAGCGAVFRIIPEKIVPLEELNLPKAIDTLAHLQQGLVLVTGPTGSGKSTTLAAVIDRINTTYQKHVVTIEDPVE